MAEQHRLVVGIDWATQFHQVCVLDADRQVLKEVKIEHSRTGIAQLVELLMKLSDNQPERVAVAIEMPRGALVETLVERHFAVFPLNPKQTDRSRDRHTVVGAKDDSPDAFVIADSLRTDLHLFHWATLDEPAIVRLRELTRAEKDPQDDAVRTGHRLRELLTRYVPQMLNFCPGMDEPWFWELLELAPMPARAAQSKVAKVDVLLKKHCIRRLTAEEIANELRTTALRLAPGAAEAASEHVLQLLPLLRLFREQQSTVAAKVQASLDELSEPGQSGEHRDVAILLSLPGVGRKIAATMLAEASQPPAERDYHALRTYSGTAPI
ncbi:MAG: IS110 family transposase [Acidobacteria bacterium]|nr:IS110 family transposase [Acidobacteriota bacterium]